MRKLKLTPRSRHRRKSCGFIFLQWDFLAFLVNNVKGKHCSKHQKVPYPTVGKVVILTFLRAFSHIFSESVSPISINCFLSIDNFMLKINIEHQKVLRPTSEPPPSDATFLGNLSTDFDKLFFPRLDNFTNCRTLNTFSFHLWTATMGKVLKVVYEFGIVGESHFLFNLDRSSSHLHRHDIAAVHGRARPSSIAC